MGFTIIDYGVVEDCPDCNDKPSAYDYNMYAVVKCDRCGQGWYVNKFHLWEKADWTKES